MIACEHNHELIHFLFWLIGILCVLVVLALNRFIRVMRETNG